jgi:hypothetical protein
MAHEVDRCTPESLDQQVRLAGRQVEIARPKKYLKSQPSLIRVSNTFFLVIRTS